MSLLQKKPQQLISSPLNAMTTTLPFILFASTILGAEGWPSVAGTCYATRNHISSMGSPQVSGTGGYSIVAPEIYTPGVPFTVQITGLNPFKGFLLYAYDSSNNRVGQFSSSYGHSVTSGCSTPATISQKDASLKGKYLNKRHFAIVSLIVGLFFDL